MPTSEFANYLKDWVMKLKVLRKRQRKRKYPQNETESFAIKVISSSPKKLLPSQKCGIPAQGRCQPPFSKETLLRDILLGNGAS